MEQRYTVSDLIDKLIEEYKLENPKNNRSAYTAEVYRILHETGIWDHAIIEKKGKKKLRYFSEQQKNNLIANKRMYNYLIKSSTSDEIRSQRAYEKIQEDIRKRRERYIEHLSSLKNTENSLAPRLSDDEFIQCKNNMMLQAIFECFFTPINESLLYDDLYQMLLKDELDITIKDINAEKRLSHPEGNYYKKRPHNKQ